jgi:hypothetical protein
MATTSDSEDDDDDDDDDQRAVHADRGAEGAIKVGGTFLPVVSLKLPHALINDLTAVSQLSPSVPSRYPAPNNDNDNGDDSDAGFCSSLPATIHERSIQCSTKLRVNIVQVSFVDQMCT